MKRFMLIPLIAILTGCPGENVGVGSWRSYNIFDNTICFTVDKSDVLSRYNVSSMQGDTYKTLAVAERVALSYPDTCIKVSLSPGYVYASSYSLNGEKYRYNFFIDNNGQVLSTRAGEE
uniref:putative T6SS immunity periplasmic lipoprotein n=1 Tax=Scandinavium goeteborgense TaxID=1851514 RepID=UPI001357AD6E|nr:putative T6SS immunity periplasmic lipoprotein [Scandinavium goeteborgense]